MLCKACQSSRQGEFLSEITIQFYGVENLDKPCVLIFPSVTVCLDCGFAEFRVPQEELRSLASTNPATKSAKAA